MDKEKLIEEVRKYPVLYDIADSKYSDAERKEKVWRKIATALSQPVSECKKVWRNLREYHRRSIKKAKTVSGQGVIKKKKWHFEREMAFLLPHYTKRSTLTSNIIGGQSESSDDGDDEDSVSTVGNLATPENDSHESLIITESASAVLMRYLLENKEKHEQNQNDDMDKFFLAVSATVKKLTTYNQAMLKSKIYSLVSEAEISELSKSQHSQNCLNDFIAPGGSTNINTSDNYVQQPEQTHNESTVDDSSLTGK